MPTKPSQSRRLVIATAAAALAVPLVLWVTGGRDAASIRSADAVAAPGRDGDDGDVEPASPREPVGVAPPASSPATARASAEAPGEEAPQEAEPPPPGGIGFLTVLVRSRETGEPLEGVRLLALLDDLEDERVLVHHEAHRGSEEDALVTDELGVAVFALPAGRAARLDVRDERYAPRHTQRAVAPFATAEEREVIVELTTEPDLAFHGRLVSGVDGGPIEGADIDVRQAGRALFRVASDADGTFALRTSSWRNAYLRIEADGFGPALVPVTADHWSAERRREIVLEEAAAIEFTVVDAHNTTRDDVGLEVTARPRGLARGPGDPAHADAERFAWSSRTRWWMSDTGRIDGLPPGVPLAIVLVGPGSQRETETIVLAPGEVRRLQLYLKPPVELAGRLVDRSGGAVPRKEVWLLPSDGSGARYLDCLCDVERTVTDPNGRFVFLEVYEGSYLVGPSPACRPKPECPGSSNDEQLASLGFPVQVRSDAVNEIELRVDRELRIHGRVVDGDGNPVRGSSVAAVPVDDDGRLGKKTDAEGAFDIGPLQQGRFTLRASVEINGEPWVSRPRTVPAGARDVELRVDPIRGRIRGFVLDAVSGEPRGDVPVVAVPGTPRPQSWRELRSLGGVRDVSHRLNGEFVLTGLEPGTYTLVASGKHALGSEVVTLPSGNGEVLGVVVPAWTSGELVVRLPEPRRWTLRAWGHGLFLGETDVWGKTEERLYLPGGRLTVELSSWRAPSAVKIVDLPPGGEARVVFGGDGG